MTMKTQNWLRFVRNSQMFIICLRNIYIRHLTIKVRFYLGLNFRFAESREFSARYLNATPVRSMAFTKFFIRPHLMSRGGSRILSHSVSSKSLLGCPIHIKNSNTSYIPVGDPSTETLPSGHHKYASHTCCS